MSGLVDIAWPYRVRDRDICYEPEGSAHHEKVKMLEISGEIDKLKIEIMKKTFSEFSDYSGVAGQFLRLVIITRSWFLSDKSHEKFVRYNVSQEAFTKILDIQGLTDFYCQTRADGVGLFTSAVSHWDKAGQNDNIYFALIYDAFLGLWAKYEHTTRQWQGTFIIPESSLDLEAIAKRLGKLANTRMFLYHLAAEYTADFLGVKSGELPQKLVEIERHSGHHALRLRPAPATYKKLEYLSANATAAANQISFYNGVIRHLADELLQHLVHACRGEHNEAEDAKEHVAYLERCVKSLSAYLSYLERRAERQITATFHLVSQANASTNLEVAHDTKTLAIASKHEASSMKILTAMTTIFLRGAFMASLFSTGMFNWSATDGAPVVSRLFWIYWSLTIPLTVITVGLWIGWEFWERRNRKREHGLVDIQEHRFTKDICRSLAAL